MRRGASLLLIVSLVLNVFLAGAIGGGLWRWSHGGFRTGWRARAADVLPADQAKRFRQTMRATVRGSLPLVQAGRDERATAARLFAAPAFDAPAAMAALDRARAADIMLRMRLEHQVVAFAATLPADQRIALAGALRTGPLRQPRRR